MLILPNRFKNIKPTTRCVLWGVSLEEKIAVHTLLDSQGLDGIPATLPYGLRPVGLWDPSKTYSSEDKTVFIEQCNTFLKDFFTVIGGRLLCAFLTDDGWNDQENSKLNVSFSNNPLLDSHSLVKCDYCEEITVSEGMNSLYALRDDFQPILVFDTKVFPPTSPIPFSSACNSLTRAVPDSSGAPDILLTLALREEDAAVPLEFRTTHLLFEHSVLCVIPNKALMKSVIAFIIQSLVFSIKDRVKYKDWIELDVFHFYPPQIETYVSLLCSLENENSNVSSEMRSKLLSRFCISFPTPLFLPSINHITFSRKEKKWYPLRDVHLSLCLDSQVHGELQFVKGSFDYYHYMHHGFDDSGWGCAYRSLQTVISWFVLQGFGNVPIPSHREIQSFLVELGDKQKSFIGSKDWIGAIEISLILQKLFGVDSKILHFRSGEEIKTKTLELVSHFKNEGTPVMIGGGVLAYTLLGIDHNEQNGETKYLILDPHYTKTDKIDTILHAGWCGWKDLTLFRKDAFYNFCLPLRKRFV